ncbi:uncharacterized protein LOC103872024 [Brassica rapa]|uniref:Uncharacterized protein n=1 Tax=Brassica campestris TaxID=3711 RepID=M4DTA3_BRACM|nr:uncharacterized protein LOC103872024 [Brassica rapa]XP_033129069.1 uncharacterized protein LOC103872024 [Brassica rapa]
MYFFGLSKEQVLSQRHVVSCKETSKQNPTSTVTLFGRQVYPVKRESSNLSNGCMRIQDIDLRLPADHYTCNEEKEALATSWSGKRNPRIVIDLEQLPTAEDEDSISYATVKSPETKPSFLAHQSLLQEDGCDKASDMESGLLDLNSFPDADELVSEPRCCFLQDLNCPYIEETDTSCEKSGIDDETTPLCSPKSQNVREKDGTASPASDTSCCTTEDNLRRGSSPRAPDPSCRTRLEFPLLPEKERCNEEEEDFSEVIQMAAESLVHISSVSYRNQEPVSRTSSLSQDQDLKCCSCDSYELHTLGISETNTEEDLCVSSMAMDELNNITRDGNKEMGLKLRRGRRMKHFQKEILPNLTSLSRHEIREDINILEAVLRSREYKKMQGKTKDVIKLGANQKNKRSVSQRYVGKRRRKHE